jgi:hypothetical protein
VENNALHARRAHPQIVLSSLPDDAQALEPDHAR